MNAATPSLERLVRDYFASFATGNVDSIAGFVADDFRNEHTAALGADGRGRQTYRERLPGFLADMAGLRYEIESLVIDEEAGVAAVFYRMTASWQGTAPFEVRGAQRLEVEDGFISRRTDYWDSARFLVQVDEGARDALARFGVTAT